MIGIDDWLAGLSEGGSALVVILVATLLGLRHATDPDHIAAVTTLALLLLFWPLISKGLRVLRGRNGKAQNPVE